MHSVAPTVDDAHELSSGRSVHGRAGFAAYVVTWRSIYAFHVACALYYVAAGILFRVTQYTYMTTRFQLTHTTLSFEYFSAIAVVHFMIGSVHTGFVAEPFGRLLYHIVSRSTGRPSHRTSSTLIRRLQSSIMVARFASTIPLAIERRVPQSLRITVRTAYAKMIGREGIFGIESRHFDNFLVARELIECILQAYQAYQMSKFLSRPWLNRLFVVTLIANCWTTPLLHYFVKDESLRRLLDRLCDVVLDFLASAGVPFALVWSYRHDFDPTTADFPFMAWRDELWTMSILNESPLVFFGSWIDAISRLLFSIGLLLSLDDIKYLVRQRQRATNKRVHPQSNVQPVLTTVSSNIKIPVSDTRMLRLGHGLLIAFGVALLGIHVHAELQSPLACLFQTNPWFVPTQTCVIAEFSCYTNREFTGDAADFHRVFSRMTPSALTRIAFRHCKSVKVQSAIQQFANLERLSVYNSTIHEWGDQAALTNAFHPRLNSIRFIRTQFADGSLPPGLLSHDFPVSLTDAAFCITNLETIPDDLDDRWPPGLRLIFEFGALTTYPLAFTRLHPFALSLTSNLITDVPNEAFAVRGQVLLVLSENPISYLPDHVPLASELSLIYLYATNLVVLPTWLVEAALSGAAFVSVGRTPYCANLLVHDASASSVDAG